MAIGGLARLGGRDWDALLAEHLAGVFEKQFGEDPRYDMVSVRRLLESAEEVKNALSARQQTRVHVERGGHSADITVTRTMFEELAEPLIEQARRLTEGVLTYSGLTRRDLAHLILVGGASRMPMIVKMLETLTDLKPATSVHPDEAVARGAALYAANLIDTRTGRTPRIALELTNLTAHNVGMEWTDPESGRVENVVLIARGTELPCGMITQVTTTEDGQTAFEFQLLEGDSREADKCARIGKVVISGLPAGLPKGWPIQVQCQYTAVGRVQIKAQIEKTGQELTVELRRPSALAESEVAEWRKLLANREGMAALRLLGERLEKKQAEAAAAAQSAALPAAVAMGGPPPTTVTQNVGVIEDIQLAPREESLSRNLRRGRNTPRQLAIMAIGYVISAALGLGIGYYILMRIDPAYNWWHLRLPGLASPPPAAAPAG
jgi:molecular chaperone DnaK (HSP70)